MEIKFADSSFELCNYEAAAFVAYDGETELGTLCESKAQEVRKALADMNFSGKAGSVCKVAANCKSVKFIIASGAGKKTCPNRLDHVRTAAYGAVRKAADYGCKSVALWLPDGKEAEYCRAAAEGAVLAGYRFDKYLTNRENDHFTVPEVTFVNADEAAAREGQIIAESQNFARSIANEPANKVSPAVLAEKAQALAAELGLSCEIWDENKAEAERMGAFLAVGSGSANPPRFIKLEYAPENAKKHIVLVGKGLTFDSGGLDIKPENFMLTMKGDKTGACTVLGAIRAAALLKLPVKVSVVIAAAENMPSGSAFRPDDILTARNGKTIEVVNTDAEGRLTLADALCFASELKPDLIIDIATLTGACAVALGSSTAGIFSNNDEAADCVLSAGKRAGEGLWRLPMTDKNLREAIKGTFADVLNCGERYGGAITAAMFLEEFVADETPWVHIDIAGADFISKPWGYYCKGMTAFGTRTLINVLCGK